ncbi:hypothetical protein Tsubulata_015899 [Turnera subulata]|uniref:Cytochrome b561 domain-containing protein n=1 Tax=Turnera subulata TaxID=218843 RepID=A0A9Q0FVJ7_9ROSI|nr:hypothetical protein Tsubulata_015899 [Turnera subulata]
MSNSNLPSLFHFILILLFMKLRLAKEDKFPYKKSCSSSPITIFCGTVPVFSGLIAKKKEKKTMAKNYGFLICLLIIIFDVVAGILGIEAEVAQNKVKHLKMFIFECRDPSYQAFKLGVAAAVLLTLAHAIAVLLGGCICVRSKEEYQTSTANRQLAVASHIFAWIILAVGFSMLMIGALANTRSRKTCGISHHRVLSIGGILCFIHGLFAVAYYVSATASAREETRPTRPHTNPTPV